MLISPNSYVLTDNGIIRAKLIPRALMVWPNLNLFTDSGFVKINSASFINGVKSSMLIITKSGRRLVVQSGSQVLCSNPEMTCVFKQANSIKANDLVSILIGGDISNKEAWLAFGSVGLSVVDIKLDDILISNLADYLKNRGDSDLAKLMTNGVCIDALGFGSSDFIEKLVYSLSGVSVNSNLLEFILYASGYVGLIGYVSNNQFNIRTKIDPYTSLIFDVIDQIEKVTIPVNMVDIDYVGMHPVVVNSFVIK